MVLTGNGPARDVMAPFKQGHPSGFHGRAWQGCGGRAWQGSGGLVGQRSSGRDTIVSELGVGGCFVVVNILLLFRWSCAILACLQKSTTPQPMKQRFETEERSKGLTQLKVGRYDPIAADAADMEK